MNKARLILSFVRIGLVAAVAVFIVAKISSANNKVGQFLKSAFRSRTEVSVLEGVIEEIKPIKELTAARYNAVTSVIEQGPVPQDSWWNPFSKRGETVYIVKGEVLAGIDCSDITLESLSISGDTLFVRMPGVQILDIIINPSDITVFDETGAAAQDGHMMDFVTGVKYRLASKALSAGLFKQANESAMNTLRQIFMAAGFRAVEFIEPAPKPTTDPIEMPVLD